MFCTSKNIQALNLFDGGIIALLGEIRSKVLEVNRFLPIYNFTCNSLLVKSSRLNKSVN